MARFSGVIGFTQTTETSPGIQTEGITERLYKGDIIKEARSYEGSAKVNTDLVITNRFSILADSFSYQNIGSMRYVVYLGTKWKIGSVDIEKPRIILTVNGVYNG